MESGDGDAMESFPGLGEEDFPGFPADLCPLELPNLARHHSTLADTLKDDPSLYARLRTRETMLGVSLARCIKVGMDNRGHKMVKGLGVVAGDEACFDVFHELFDRVIQRHHSDSPVTGICDTHPTDLGRHGSRLTAESADPTGRYVMASSMRASRNLSGFRFPPAMSRLERREVERLVAQALVRGPEPGGGEYLPLRGSQSYVPRPTGMSTEEEAALQDAGLLFEAPDSTWRLCTGAGRHWPHGRGVFLDGDRTTAVWVNEQEHIRVTSTQQGDALQLAFRRVVGKLDAVADDLHRRGLVEGRCAFAHTARLGFLSSNLANLGTAMHVNMTLRLPHLAQQQDSHWREWCVVQRVQVRGTSIEAGGAQLPDVFELSNCDRLGVSEVDTVNLLVRVASQLVQAEQRLELGLPADDMLASVCFGAGLRAPPALPAGPAAGGAAQKARSGLLLGLLAGRLPAALASAGGGGGGGGGAAAGAAPPELLGGRHGSAAEQVVSDVLQFAVEDHAASVASKPVSVDMAEEVMSTSCLDDSRPLTGESMATVVALSDVSVNGATAQEIVDDLVNAEIEARMDAAELGIGLASGAHGNTADGCIQAASATTASRVPSKAQILETKQKVSALLNNACMSGELVRALGSVDQSSPEAVEEGASLEVLRERVKEGLLDALDCDRLEGYLQDTFATQKSDNRSSQEINAWRREMAGVLEKALHSGELEAALEESSACKQAKGETPGKEAVDELRAQTLAALSCACQSGELEAAWQSIKPSRPAQAEPAQGCEEGLIPAAVLPGPSRMRPSVLLALQLLSRHDQRLGELTAKIQIAERRLAGRSETCREMEDMIAAARADLSHLELDIEWHRRALETAEERNAELELSQRRLLGSLDLQQQKSLDGGPSIASARSELSTTTGFTTASMALSSCSYLPRPGHALLEPLTQR